MNNTLDVVPMSLGIQIQHLHDELYNAIYNRNHLQTKPYTDIYTTNYRLWRKSTLIDSQRTELRHQISILEHETAEFVNKKDFISAVENVKKSFRYLHSSIAENSTDSIPFTNLSKTIYDQRKLLQNQADEIRMLKEERALYMEKNVSMERDYASQNNEILALQNTLNDTETKLQEAVRQITELTAERDHLVQRIMNDKLRVADELNLCNEQSEVLLRANSSKSNIGSATSVLADRAESTSLLLQLVHLRGEAECSWQCHASETAVNAALLLWDGKLLASAGSDSTVVLTSDASSDVSSPGGSAARTLLSGGAVTSMDCVFPSEEERDRTALLGACEDGVCRVWSASTGRLLSTLTGHTKAATGAVFIDSVGSRAVSCSADKSIKLWDLGRAGGQQQQQQPGSSSVSAGTPLWTVKSDAAVTSLATSRLIRGSHGVVITGHVDGCVRSWDTNSGQCLSTLTPSQTLGSAVHVQVNPFDSNVYSVLHSQSSPGNTSSGKLSLVDARMNKTIHVISHVDWLMAGVNSSKYAKASFSPDGRYIAAGGCASSSTARGEAVFVWNTADGRLLTKLSRNNPGPVGRNFQSVSPPSVTAVSWWRLHNGVDKLLSCYGDGVVTAWV